MAIRKTRRKPKRAAKRKPTVTKTVKTLVKNVRALKAVTEKKYDWKEQWFWPGVTDYLTTYQCHAMIRPITMQPIWKLAGTDDLAEKGKRIKVVSLKMRGAVSVGSETGPLNFDVFLFRIRQKYRPQFGAMLLTDEDLNASPKLLKEGVHFMQQYGPQAASTTPFVKNQFTMMNPKIFDVKKHMHFRLGSSTLGTGVTGAAPSSLNFPPSTHNMKDTVRDFSWSIPINKYITCDDDSWKDATNGIHTYQVPANIQYYFIVFTDNSSVDLQGPGVYVNSIITTERG